MSEQQQRGHAGSKPLSLLHPSAASEPKTYHCTRLSLAPETCSIVKPPDKTSSSNRQIGACSATHHRANALPDLPIEIREQLAETTILNLLSLDSRICISRVAHSTNGVGSSLLYLSWCGLSKQGERDANAGKGVTWYFSSTLQLVHVSTGKVIGAAISLSIWMACPLHLHPT